MPLYIRDDHVNDLAEQLATLTGARSKTAAVEAALKSAISAAKAETPLSDRIKVLQDRVAARGPTDPDFDMKAFTDELWGEDDVS